MRIVLMGHSSHVDGDNGTGNRGEGLGARRLTTELRRLGHEVVTVQGAGCDSCGLTSPPFVPQPAGGGDLVHCWGDEALPAAAVVALELGVPLVHSAFGGPSRAGLTVGWGRMLYQTLPVSLHLAHDAGARDAARAFGVLPERIRQVPPPSRAGVGEAVAAAYAEARTLHLRGRAGAAAQRS
ncbi:hypothetical protein ACFU5N_29200 [Streptomyces albidoflavus]